MATTKTTEEKKMSMDDISKMFKQMQDKLDKIEEENKELKTKRADAPNPVPVKNPEMEELVPIQLFKDKNKYKDDVFIAINGQRVQVQRGIQVMLPKKYAKVLQRSMEQDAETADLIEAETSQWQNKAKILGL